MKESGKGAPPHLITEVAPPCCRLRGDDGYPLGKCGECALYLIEVQDAILPQLLDGLSADALQIAKRMIGVNVLDVERKTILLMKRDAHSHQELHPYLRVTARYIAEALQHAPGSTGPHGGSCGGYFSPAFIRLCQLKVDVSGGGI